MTEEQEKSYIVGLPTYLSFEKFAQACNDLWGTNFTRYHVDSMRKKNRIKANWYGFQRKISKTELVQDKVLPISNP